MNNLMYPQDDAIIDTHTQIQNTFINSIRENGINAALDWLLPIKCNEELSVPIAVNFVWEEQNAPYVFEISEENDFFNAYVLTVNENKVTVSNFKVGQKYYWRVNGGEIHNFETVDNSYRFIGIDGALNVRDIGGINIKQGLIFRGSDIESVYPISQKGKEIFTEQLKIKTEIELRIEGDNYDRESVAGKGVQYKYFPYRPYLEIFEQQHKDRLALMMDFFADENNYPMYIHCLGGADRTGMIAMYFRAIAGECDDDIFIDYELTSLSSYAYGLAEGVSALGFRKRTASYLVKALNELNKYPGETLSERLVSFILDCGVKPETIEKIRRIILK